MYTDAIQKQGLTIDCSWHFKANRATYWWSPASCTSMDIKTLGIPLVRKAETRLLALEIHIIYVCIYTYINIYIYQGRSKHL